MKRSKTWLRRLWTCACAVASTALLWGSAHAQVPIGCTIPDPTTAQLQECFEYYDFQSSCASAAAGYITDRGTGLGEFAGCGTRGDCYPLAVDAVGGVCLGGGAGTGVAGAGSTGDVAQENVVSVFSDHVVVRAVPESLLPQAGGAATSTANAAAGGAGAESGATGAGAPAEEAPPGAAVSGEKTVLRFSAVDANVTADFWEADPIDGSTYQISLGYSSTSDGSTFFADGAYSRIDGDDVTCENTARGKLGWRWDLGDYFLIGLYGNVDWVDSTPDDAFLYGGGLLSGAHFVLGPAILSLGVVGQGVLSDIDRPDGKTDYVVSVAYGGGVGVPLFESFAFNLQAYRTTALKPGDTSDLEDVGSFTTLLVSGDYAVTRSFVLNLGYRTRFEIDNYSTNAVFLGMRAFFL